MSRSSSHWTIIGNADCRRVARFQTALTQRNKRSARFVSYGDLLARASSWDDILLPGTFVRFESAAESWQTRRQLLNYGYNDALSSGYKAADPQFVARMVTSNAAAEFKPRQLYLGYRRLLREMEVANAKLDAVPIQAPQDVLCMFDKWTCQRRLSSSQVAVPELLARPTCYEEVRMASGRDGRTILKMAHGSGGVGCVAMHWSRGRVRAFVSSQTMEMVDPRLADRNVPVQKIDDEVLLAQVVDAVCHEKAHLEVWLPKARFQGKPYDLRVVVIAGQACHAIARLGHSPFTNLNLGGERHDVNQQETPVSKYLGEKVQVIAGQVARCFPQTLHFGLDLLVTPRGELKVIEVNAFGDLLLNVLHKGKDPYAAEIDAAESWRNRAPVRQLSESAVTA